MSSLRFLHVGIVLSLVLSSQIEILAANRTWDGSTSSDWSNASNWDTGVPTESDIAFVDALTGKPNPVIDTDTAVAQELKIGNVTGNGQVLQVGGSLSVQTLRLGNIADKTGKLIMTAGTVNVSNEIRFELGRIEQSGGTIDATELNVSEGGINSEIYRLSSPPGQNTLLQTDATWLSVELENTTFYHDSGIHRSGFLKVGDLTASNSHGMKYRLAGGELDVDSFEFGQVQPPRTRNNLDFASSSAKFTGSGIINFTDGDVLNAGTAVWNLAPNTLVVFPSNYTFSLPSATNVVVHKTSPPEGPLNSIQVPAGMVIQGRSQEGQIKDRIVLGANSSVIVPAGDILHARGGVETSGSGAVLILQGGEIIFPGNAAYSFASNTTIVAQSLTMNANTDLTVNLVSGVAGGILLFASNPNTLTLGSTVDLIINLNAPYPGTGTSLRIFSLASNQITGSFHQITGLKHAGTNNQFLLRYNEIGGTVTSIDIITVHDGDANADGSVNQADLTLVQNNEGEPVRAGSVNSGDLNGDGAVDEDDVAIVNANL